jgi:hypothetical protein
MNLNIFKFIYLGRSFGELEKNSSIEKLRILLINRQLEIHLWNGEATCKAKSQNQPNHAPLSINQIWCKVVEIVSILSPIHWYRT